MSDPKKCGQCGEMPTVRRYSDIGGDGRIVSMFVVHARCSDIHGEECAASSLSRDGAVANWNKMQERDDA